VEEPGEYGRHAADATDSRENAYSDARSAGLLYLEDNATVYPEAGNKGWLERHKKTKPIFWTDTYPADLVDTMREAHLACIPPRYTENDVEVARFEHSVAGILGDQPLQSHRSLLQSMDPELREGAALTAAIEVILREQPATNINSFVRRVRRALDIQTTHVWRRDDRGVVLCVATQGPHLLEDPRNTSGLI